jgi:exosome complex component RRP4
MEVEPVHDFVTPGTVIPSDADSMPGYGTYRDADGTIKASIFGTVGRVNKLICVDAFASRYKGSTGDIVVGRVSQVA